MKRIKIEGDSSGELLKKADERVRRESERREPHTWAILFQMQFEETFYSVNGWILESREEYEVVNDALRRLREEIEEKGQGPNTKNKEKL